METVRRIQAGDDGRKEALRALGGLLLGIGIAIAAIRKSAFTSPLGDGALLLVLLVPAVILYVGGIVAARAAGPKLWHAVWVLVGLGYVYASLIQFLQVLDASTDAPLNNVWTLLVVAAFAVAGAVVARVRFAWLIAAAAIVGAWFFLWEEILSDGLSDQIGAIRALSMIATAGLIAGAYALNRRVGRPEASELITVAGLVFITGAGFAGTSSAATVVPGIDASPTGGGIEQNDFWNFVLLAGSLIIVAFGSINGYRGSIYVGALGLATFVGLVVADLAFSPDSDIGGWATVLLVLSALAVAGSFVSGRDSSGTDSFAPAQQPGQGDSPPPSG